MEITEIKRRVELLKKATLQKTVLIADVAKELKCRVTDLMMFIEENPNLFHTNEMWSQKKETYYETICGIKHKSSRMVNDKCKGLGITEVYLTLDENYRTQEWLDKQISENKKTIWVSEWDNYGTIEGMYIKVDGEDDIKRGHLWRNTSKKVEELKELGILKEGYFHIGGYSDCSNHHMTTIITNDGINRLKELGWRVI